MCRSFLLVEWPGGQKFLVDESYGAHRLVAYFQSMIFGSHHLGRCGSRSSGITYENWVFYCIPHGLIYYMKLTVRASAMREIITFEGVHSSNALWHVHILSHGCAKKGSVAGMQYNYITRVNKRSTLCGSERREIERLIPLHWSPLLMHFFGFRLLTDNNILKNNQ